MNESGHYLLASESTRDNGDEKPLGFHRTILMIPSAARTGQVQPPGTVARIGGVHLVTIVSMVEQAAFVHVTLGWIGS